MRPNVRERESPVKHCLYCLRPFTGRGRCCSLFCSRKVTGKAAWVTRSRKEACARVLTAAQAKLRHVPKWRQIAMGDENPETLAAIFGTGPSTDQPRHGDELDA